LLKPTGCLKSGPRPTFQKRTWGTRSPARSREKRYFSHASRRLAPPSLLGGIGGIEGSAGYALEVFGSEAWFGEHLVVRDRCVICQPGVGGFNIAEFIFADGLVFQRRGGEAASDRVGQRREKMNDGREFFCRQEIDKRVRLMAVFCGAGLCHDGIVHRARGKEPR
jgi:hypothetical protein